MDVVFENHNSDILSISCGVPQGSILGPLLFIVYINDLCNVSDLLFKILYADDTSVLIRGRDLDHLIKTLNCELHLLSNWLKANKLSLNARLKQKNINIWFDNATLTEVTSFKYLGLIIDNK